MKDLVTLANHNFIKQDSLPGRRRVSGGIIVCSGDQVCSSEKGHDGKRKERHELGRGGRGVDPGPEPSPARLLPKLGQIERRLDDATQGALGIGTEGRATFVSEGTSPTRPVPPPVLVTRWSVHRREVATSLHGIPGI